MLFHNISSTGRTIIETELGDTESYRSHLNAYMFKAYRMNTSSNIANVVYCFDIRYLRPFMVSARSLIANWKGSGLLHIHCIWKSSEENNLFIESTVLTLKNNYDVEVSVYKFLGELPYRGFIYYINESTQLRLFLPEILESLGNVLYLDCDTLIVEDISWLFLGPLPRYIAASDSDVNFMLHMKWNNGYEYRGASTFNAGVLYMNLDALRESNFSSVRSLHLDVGLNDQSILNHFCEGEHDILPSEMNAKPSTYNGNNAYILHWSSSNKPWRSRANKSIANDLWNKFDQGNS